MFNSFVNPEGSPLSHKNSGAIQLAQLGLTTGWLAGRRTKCKYIGYKF